MARSYWGFAARRGAVILPERQVGCESVVDCDDTVPALHFTPTRIARPCAHLRPNEDSQ